MQTLSRPATDIELAQARAILDLEKAGWLRADIFRALRISRMTYFRRLKLARWVEEEQKRRETD
jgi:hypothetical protein